MGDLLLEILKSNPSAYTILAILVVVLATTYVTIFIVAFFQGREIQLYPPRIGEYPGNLQPNKRTIRSEQETINKLKSALDNRERGESIDEQVESLVRDRMRNKFQAYSDFILIRYGSSVRFASKRPKDFDYLVFLLGYDKAETRKEYNEGSVISSTDSKFSVDIQYKDYNSFCFALISGLPYEHGIMHKYKYLAGNEGYLQWMKKLSENILLDSDYIVESLSNRLDDYKSIIDNDLASEINFSTVIALYSLASTLMQISYCKILPSPCSSEDIIPFAFPENMLAVIPDNDFRKAFNQIYNLFKNGATEVSIYKHDLIEIYSILSTFANGVV